MRKTLFERLTEEAIAKPKLVPVAYQSVEPAMIISDLISSSLMPPREGWASARRPYVWEQHALCYLHQLRTAGELPSINAWTWMLVDEGYPAANAGALQGHFWKPGDTPW